MYADIEVPQIIFMGDCTYSWYAFDTVSLRISTRFCTYGSAMRRSVSLIILLGSAILNEVKMDSTANQFVPIKLDDVKPGDNITFILYVDMLLTDI